MGQDRLALSRVVSRWYVVAVVVYLRCWLRDSNMIIANSSTNTCGISYTRRSRIGRDAWYVRMYGITEW